MDNTFGTSLLLSTANCYLIFCNVFFRTIYRNIKCYWFEDVKFLKRMDDAILLLEHRDWLRHNLDSLHGTRCQVSHIKWCMKPDQGWISFPNINIDKFHYYSILTGRCCPSWWRRPSPPRPQLSSFTENPPLQKTRQNQACYPGWRQLRRGQACRWLGVRPR